jgi:hypothetical protein
LDVGRGARVSEWLVASRRHIAEQGAKKSGGGAPTIVPVLWTPIPREQLRARALSIPFAHEDLVSGYAEQGLQGLMESGPEDSYHRAVRRIAHLIVAAARDSPGGDRDPHGRAK